jgi:hypothetical protein
VPKNCQLGFTIAHFKQLAMTQITIHFPCAVAIVIHQSGMTRTFKQQAIASGTIRVFIARHTQPQFGKAQTQIATVGGTIGILVTFDTDAKLKLNLVSWTQFFKRHWEESLHSMWSENPSAQMGKSLVLPKSALKRSTYPGK